MGCRNGGRPKKNDGNFLVLLYANQNGQPSKTNLTLVWPWHLKLRRTDRRQALAGDAHSAWPPVWPICPAPWVKTSFTVTLEKNETLLGSMQDELQEAGPTSHVSCLQNEV